MTEPGTPVVFVHGLWLHRTSWARWIELFTAEGYAPVAPPWPGELPTVTETRVRPEPMGGHGVREVVEHYARIIGELPAKPVVIGHSFGGLIAQVLLGRGLAAAGVAIDPAPIKAVLALPPSSLRVASVALRDPRHYRGTVALTPAQFRYAFTNTRSAAESDELYARWTMPSPGRPLFQAATAAFAPNAATKVDPANANRGPLLITLGGRDHTVPPAISRATYRLHQRSPAVTDLREFPGADHSLCLNSDWRRVADAVLAWLKERR